VLVDRQLLVVGADSVPVRVRVREESALQDRVGRGLDTGDEVRRVEGGLLDFGKVVLRVPVEDDLAKLAERVVLVRPDLGEIEDVDVALLGLLRRHGLNVGLPSREVSLVDGLKQVLGGVVWGGTGELGCLLLGEELDTLLGEEVDLGVDPLALLVGELEGVSRVALHLAVAVGDTTVTEEPHDLVDRLGVVAEVVPEHGRVLGARKVGLRVALLGVDEVRELCRVAEEEDGRVVEDPVHVALARLQLDGEASWVTGGVGGAGLATDGRESDGDRAFEALVGEAVCEADVLERLCALENTVGSGSLGVDDTLRDALSIKVREEIDKVEVLEEERSILSDALCLVGVRHGDTVRRGVDVLLGLSIVVVRLDVVVETGLEVVGSHDWRRCVCCVECVVGV